MNQPDYFQLACDITRKRAEELTRACVHCHEDNSGTVMLCPLHVQAPAMREALRLAYDAMNYMGDILNDMDAVETEDMKKTAKAFETVRAILRAIEGA